MPANDAVSLAVWSQPKRRYLVASRPYNAPLFNTLDNPRTGLIVALLKLHPRPSNDVLLTVGGLLSVLHCTDTCGRLVPLGRAPLAVGAPLLVTPLGRCASLPGGVCVGGSGVCLWATLNPWLDSWDWMARPEISCVSAHSGCHRQASGVEHAMLGPCRRCFPFECMC